MMHIRFIRNSLTVRCIGDGRWMLTEPFIVMVNEVEITVPAGFVTDFASVPRLPFTFAMFGDLGHGAAVLHDWLYSGQGVIPFFRKDADLVLRYALIEDGVPAWKAWIMWAAVRAFGGKHFTEQCGGVAY